MVGRHRLLGQLHHSLNVKVQYCYYQPTRTPPGTAQNNVDCEKNDRKQILSVSRTGKKTMHPGRSSGTPDRVIDPEAAPSDGFATISDSRSFDRSCGVGARTSVTLFVLPA